MVYILFLLFTYIFATSPHPPECADSFLETRNVTLDQDTQLFANVQSVASLHDGRLVVTTEDPGIFLFEVDGTYIRQLGNAGRGPSEYQDPSVVRATETGGFAVWDRGNNKLISYDQNGRVMREWTRMARTVTDFALQGDTLYTYHSGSLIDGYVAAYTYENQQEPIFSTGEAPQEHRPLNLLTGAAPIALNEEQNRLLYASVAAPTVHSMNLRDQSVDQIPLNAPSFSTSSVAQYAEVSAINADMAGAIEQAMQSSRFLGLNGFDEHILSLIQNGRYVTDRSFAISRAGTVDTGEMLESDLKFDIHWYDSDSGIERCERIPIDVNQESYHFGEEIVGPSQRGFFRYTSRSTDSDIEYVLTEYSLPQ